MAITQTSQEPLADLDDFPSLARAHDGRRCVFFDGPAGSQVPRQVIEAVSKYYLHANANSGGRFATSLETDRMLAEARRAMADLLGAEGPGQISFGANMTTLTFLLARALARRFEPGDEIVITELDHEANRGPWLGLRQEGMVVREIELRPDGTLNYDDFRSQINSRTRLVALGHASNALGTVNDVASARRWSREAGAWLLVDAVHSAPHLALDVREMGADFLLCSGYKFYGPHVGVLYCRPGLLEQLPTERLRTQSPRAPERIETGTLNHASIAGLAAAVDYLASLGEGPDRRSRTLSAFRKIEAHEGSLARRLHRGLSEIPGVHLYGPGFDQVQRAPTVSFTVEGLNATEVADRLAAQGMNVWDGDFYAARAIEVLGLVERGGLVRTGMAIYNHASEVERVLQAVRELAA